MQHLRGWPAATSSMAPAARAASSSRGRRATPPLLAGRGCLMTSTARPRGAARACAPVRELGPWADSLAGCGGGGLSASRAVKPTRSFRTGAILASGAPTTPTAAPPPTTARGMARTPTSSGGRATQGCLLPAASLHGSSSTPTSGAATPPVQAPCPRPRRWLSRSLMTTATARSPRPWGLLPRPRGSSPPSGTHWRAAGRGGAQPCGLAARRPRGRWSGSGSAGGGSCGRQIALGRSTRSTRSMRILRRSPRSTQRPSASSTSACAPPSSRRHHQIPRTPRPRWARSRPPLGTCGPPAPGR
mmetsp:Transcript_69996/g.221790  ORF Transcript_69996/g.221790 Transcript_69996/m.221790 type:complete len:302 (+) Transcript_69996:4659-5564(+)